MSEEHKNGSGAPSSDTTSALFISARKKQLEQEVQERHLKAERTQTDTDSDAVVKTKETAEAASTPLKVTKKIGKTTVVVIGSLCIAFVVLIITLLVSTSSKIDPNAELDAVVNMNSANMGIRYPSSVFALDDSGDGYVSLSTHDPDGAMIF